MSRCAIVILCYNCVSRTDAFIKNLIKLTNYPYYPFFVNNGSTDLTQKLLSSIKEAVVISIDKNVGVPGGRNVAIKSILDNHPECDYVCFLDNDVDLNENWLPNLISILNQNPNIGVIGPVTNNSNNPIQDISRKRTISKKMFALEASFSKNEFAITSRVDGFCMVMHRNIINKLGYFDTDYVTIGYEDHDYCRRIKEIGFACAVSLRTFIMHDGGFTLKQNKINTNFYEINKQRYLMKWDNPRNLLPVNVFIPLTNVNNKINITSTEKVNFSAVIPYKKDYHGIMTPIAADIPVTPTTLPVFTSSLSSSLSDLTLCCYIKKADGLGKIGIKLFEHFINMGLKINHKRLEVFDMSNVPQTIQDNLNKYPAYSDVVLLTNQAYYLDRIEKRKRMYIFTMFESTLIPDDWVNRINNKIDEVFVPDEYQKTTFLNSGVKKPISIIPLGIELEHYQYKPRVNDNKFCFGFSGMFTQRKNIKDLIRAFKVGFPEKDYPHVHLHIHGRWGIGENSKVQFNAVINNDKRIKVDEGVFGIADFKKWWDKIDCYVFASKGEGFSLTPREAIAQGIPTIVSNYSAHVPLIKSGYFYSIEPCGEEPAFYEFINRICGNQAKIDFNDIAKSMQYVYSHYDEALQKAKEGSEWIKNQPNWSDVSRIIIKEILPENIMVCESFGKACGVGDFTGHIKEEMKNDPIKFVNKLDYAVKIAESKKTKYIYIQHEYSLYNGNISVENCLKRLKGLGVKIIIIIHSILDDAVHTSINNMLCAYSDEIIVMNPLGADTLKRTSKNNAGKIKFIHHPCYNVPFKKLSVQKKLIGTFGFMHGQKGYNYIMEAIKNTDYKLRLVCHGDPNHPVFVQPYKGKVNFEHIYEHQPFDKILSLLSECEIIILPSVDHPNGMFGASGSIRVAITSGRPVICSNATHFSEFDKEMPKFVQKNSDDLKDKINNLINSEDEQNKIINNLKIYMETNSMKNYCDIFRKNFKR